MHNRQHIRLSGVIHNFFKTIIRKPGLVNRWLQDDRKPAMRISCNSCFKPASKKAGFIVWLKKRAGKGGQKITIFWEDEKHWLPIMGSTITN